MDIILKSACKYLCMNMQSVWLEYRSILENLLRMPISSIDQISNSCYLPTISCMVNFFVPFYAYT